MTIELVDSAEIPGGGHLQLLRRGSDFSIVLGDDELMGSRASHSEQALAILACDRMAPHHGNILIGGLGMGFTLGAALSVLPQTSKIVVAELMPQVVKWAAGPLAHLFGTTLSDPRLFLDMRDVHDVIDEADGIFDGIILDVDNGPDGFVCAANERLYSAWGLRAAYAALRPTGVLAIWSAYPDDEFVERLIRAGFAVEEIAVPDAKIGRRAMHTIWLAEKPR